MTTFSPGYFPTSLFANLPSAATASQNNGILVTDVGMNGTVMRPNPSGTAWVSHSSEPITLSANGVAIGLPGTGSIANNGAFTAGNAFTNIKANTGMFLYFPTSAIVAGSTAGFYYTVMSSTTAGTIYNNTYTSGTPLVPASLTSFVTTGPGAFTQPNTETTLLSLPIPANLMGNQNVIQISAYANIRAATTPSVFVRYGGTQVYTENSASTNAIQLLLLIGNAGNNKVQINPLSAQWYGPQVNTIGSAQYSIADTTASANLTISATIAATSYFLLAPAFITLQTT